MASGMRTTLRGLLLLAANIVGLGAYLWPFLIPSRPGAGPHAVDAPLVLGALVALLGLVLFAQLSRSALGVKSVALLGVLAGLMVALRLPGFVAGFSAMWIIVLTAGNAFGPSFGFVLGAVGTLASGLFVGGLGPWLPFQMVAVGWVGAGAGLLWRRGPWLRRIGVLATYGAVAGYVFGAIMNLWFWPFRVASGPLSWEPGASLANNLERYAAFYAVTSFAWDSFAAAGNALLVVVLGRPLLQSLDRAARRMRLSLGEWDGSRPGGRGPGGDAEAEESPGSAGQDAGESPRRGDPWTVPQKADRLGSIQSAGVRVKR